jgi:hypothetical protein
MHLLVRQPFSVVDAHRLRVGRLRRLPERYFYGEGGRRHVAGPNRGEQRDGSGGVEREFGLFHFFQSEILQGTRVSVSRRGRAATGARLLEDCEKFGAAVGADAKVLRYAGWLQGDALGAATRGLHVLLEQ